MAFDLERMPDGIVVVRGQGKGSIEESDQVIAAVVQAWGSDPVRRAIFDVRDLDYLPSTPDAEHIARTHSQAAAGGDCAVAYVARPGAPYGVARMIETLGDIRGLQAAVFTDFDEAREWLLTVGRRSGT